MQQIKSIKINMDKLKVFAYTQNLKQQQNALPLGKLLFK